MLAYGIERTLKPVLIFAAILAIFVYGMIAAMLGTILPDLSERFKLTPTQNGTIAIAQALGLMIASLGVGPLLDTEGDKIGLILGLVLIAVALLAAAARRGIRQHRVSAVSAGSGRGHRGHGRQCAGQRRERERTALRLLNLVNLFFGLGGLFTPFISANLFHAQLGAALLHGRRADHRLDRRPGAPHHARAGAGTRDSFSPRPVPSSATRCCFCSVSSFFSTSPAKSGCGTGSRAISLPRAFPSRARSIFSRWDLRWACCWAAWRCLPF